MHNSHQSIESFPFINVVSGTFETDVNNSVMQNTTKKLTLEETADVILKWAHSVETIEQLKLVREAVQTFIVDRFSTVSDAEMVKARYKVDVAIYEKEATILFS